MTFVLLVRGVDLSVGSVLYLVRGDDGPLPVGRPALVNGRQGFTTGRIEQLKIRAET